MATLYEVRDPSQSQQEVALFWTSSDAEEYIKWRNAGRADSNLYFRTVVVYGAHVEYVE